VGVGRRGGLQVDRWSFGVGVKARDLELEGRKQAPTGTGVEPLATGDEDDELAHSSALAGITNLGPGLLLGHLRTNRVRDRRCQLGIRPGGDQERHLAVPARGGRSHQLASPAMKWIGPIVLAVVGVLAFIVGIMYVTNPIHALPSFIGGKPIVGHYTHRGEALLVAAVAALAGAGYWALRTWRAAPGSGGGAGDLSPATTDSLLGSTSPAPEVSPEP
jgi:hypothetical protein